MTDRNDVPLLAYATPQDSAPGTLVLLLKAAAVTVGIVLVSVSVFFFVMVACGVYQKIVGSAMGAALAVGGSGFLIAAGRLPRTRS